MYFVIDGAAGDNGRLASSTTLTASISITDLMWLADTVLIALAIVCAACGLSSRTVIEIIRVSVVLATVTRLRSVPYDSLSPHCFITVSNT